MDCLNPAAKNDLEPGLLGHHDTRRSRSSKATKALLVLLTILFIALLGVVVWLGVEVHKCRSDIDDLKRSSVVGSAESAYTFTSTGSAASTAAYANAALYLSKNSTSASGYVYSGSLYRLFPS
jgi:hypothetical protein